jgi:hypothetical protein
MPHVVVTAALVLATATAARADIRAGEAERSGSTRAVQKIHCEIPPDVWTSARCVAVIPELKKATDRSATAQALPTQASSVPATPRTTTMSTTDDDLRARVVDIEQTLDRLLADTTPAPVGTTGTVGATPASGTVTVDRARLLRLREQLEALIATLNRR